jgi:hypothetical protein
MNLSYYRRGLDFASAVFIVAVAMLSVAPSASGQSVLPPGPTSRPGPFSLLKPETLSLSVYGGGYISADYATTEQGLQLTQSITPNIGLVARVTGYQLYIHDDFDNPLNPGTGHQARLNFGRLQGGFDFKLLEGTYLSILGGGDVGDSHAATVEEDFSAWIRRKSPHPINLALSSIYNTENRVVSSEVDLRGVAYSTETYTLFAGGGGAIYAAGFVHGVAGQGGPIFGLYLPSWHMGFDIQSGYGSAKEYGEIAIYKQFGWTE